MNRTARLTLLAPPLTLALLAPVLAQGTGAAGTIGTSKTRVSKSRRKSVSGGLQTWRILENSGPDALETPLSSLKLG